MSMSVTPLSTPAPLLYNIPDFLSENVQNFLISRIDALKSWKEVRGRRRMWLGGEMITSDGGKSMWIPNNWPDFIQESGILKLLESQVEKLTEIVWPPMGINSCLVNEYMPSQGILPHTDGPAYHPLVLTISLCGATRLRFTPNELAPRFKDLILDDIPAAFEVEVLPGSLFVMTGEVYESWRHEIIGEQQTERRVSLTFRGVKKVGRGMGRLIGTKK